MCRLPCNFGASTRTTLQSREGVFLAWLVGIVALEMVGMDGGFVRVELGVWMGNADLFEAFGCVRTAVHAGLEP